MEKLYKIKEALWSELDKSETAKSGELKGGELEAIHKLTDAIKNIDKICMLEDGDGYSEDGGDYGRGSSYANRGKHYVRGHYSRDDGRSEMMEHLEMALDSASDQDKETIKRFMSQLEQA